MKTLVIALAAVFVCHNAGDAAIRTWKSRKGQEIKADFTGVLNGKVVLKLAGGVRQQVRLSDFSLEDRDYLVDLLTKRNNKKDLQQLNQLMLAENNVKVIDPDAVRRTPSADSGNLGYGNPGYGDETPMNPLGGNPINPNNPNLQPPLQEVETEMYGLPLPSPELLVEDQVRTWTSLTGLKQMAKFDRVLAPGFLRLKKADGTTGNFAIVNFVKEDIDYVKQALQEDMARPVFPEGSGFQSLTPEEVGKGYRVWTDRRKVTLAGKFVNVKGKDVVIEINGENKEYPKAGLSEADISWVDGEILRRAEAARAQAEANSPAGGYAGGGGSSFPRSPFSNRPSFPTRPAFPMPPSFPSSRFGSGGHDDGGMVDDFADAGDMGHADTGLGRSPLGSRFGSSGLGSGGIGSPSFGMPKYEFTCEHCGRSWTDTSSFSQCPDCKGKSFFECSRCGHKWTRTDGSIIDTCPNCSGRLDGGGSSGVSSFTSNSSSGGSSASSGSKENSGVFSTIFYVTIGLSLLGGIAGGLFKAFG